MVKGGQFTISVIIVIYYMLWNWLFLFFRPSMYELLEWVSNVYCNFGLWSLTSTVLYIFFCMRRTSENRMEIDVRCFNILPSWTFEDFFICTALIKEVFIALITGVDLIKCLQEGINLKIRVPTYVFLLLFSYSCVYLIISDKYK